MQLGIFAKTFEGKSAGVVLPQVKAAGFVTAQYNFACSGLPAMPDEVSGSTLDDIRKAVAECGVSLCALSATYNMIHPDKAQRATGHRRLRVAARAAKTLGIPLITLCTGTRDADDQWRAHPDNNSKEAWRDLCDAMAVAVGIAEETGVDLGIEPELANVVNSCAKAAQLIAEMQSKRIKIVFDPANLFEVSTLEEQRRVVSEGIDLLHPHVTMVHAKDRLGDGTFTTAGKGVLDYKHFIRELTKSGFKGPIVTHGLAASKAPDVAQFLQAQLARN
jgi:sugar phosphate isomerase/epimerase